MDETYCALCDYDAHTCPGCGTVVPHGVRVCAACQTPEPRFRRYTVEVDGQPVDPCLEPSDCDCYLTAAERAPDDPDPSVGCPRGRAREVVLELERREGENAMDTMERLWTEGTRLGRSPATAILRPED